MATFKYPGFDLDFRTLGKECYPVGFPEARGGESEIIQLREVAMMMLMEQITDKPDWQDKVFDEAIVQKWRQETAEQPETALFARLMEDKESVRIPQPPKIVTRQAFEYCIEELRNKVKYFCETGLVPTLDSSRYCVVKSDKRFSGGLRAQLVKAFEILQADQQADIDWQPKSNGLVQDLVHPSMHPFIYGKTPFLNEERVGLENATRMMGQGGAIAQPMRVNRGRRWEPGARNGCVADEYWSSTFQWLPSNVSFQGNGSVKLTSYVNNLHPVRYHSIYQTIEKAIAAAIPLWDQCLEEYREHTRVKTTDREKSRFKGVVKAECENLLACVIRPEIPSVDHTDEDATLWSDFDLEYYLAADIPVKPEDEKKITEGSFDGSSHFFEAIEAYKKSTGDEFAPTRPRSELSKDSTALVEEKRAYCKWRDARLPVYPEPLPFEEIDYAPKESIRTTYAGDGLQVMVKMSSIELTPEKPEFPAGGWHVSGVVRELF